MVIEEENFEDEEDPEEELDKEDKKEAAVKQKKNISQENKQEKPTERYGAIHQPEAIAIVDSVKGIILTDKLKDEGLAIILADIENKLDRIITALG